MTVSWTPHRFSGGALALDVANTVVLRGGAESFDRFADPAEIARFALAASRHRAAELKDRTLSVGDPGDEAPMILPLREATDRLFRANALDGGMDGKDLSALLFACADALRSEPMRIGGPIGDGPGAVPFRAALAFSALSLLPAPRAERVRICANCRWLFLDESRNRSRVWCDMAVCGNRQKARRHYGRRKSAEAHHA